VPDESGEALVTRPWATWVVAAVCAGIFLGVHAAGHADSWEGLRRWGYIPASDVWKGGWWALFTTAFVHLQIWHVGFNVYWLWILGRVLERGIGHVRWIALCLSAAFVSSAAQLAWSDQTGIGLSGVIYAFFGFMWVARRRWPEFTKVVHRDTIGIFVAWLALCIVLTRAGVWNVGNAAHMVGLLYGSLLGMGAALASRRTAALIASGALVAASVGVLFYAPWSPTWTAGRAYALHASKDYAAAERRYVRALDLGVDPAWVWGNLARLYQATGEKEKYEQALAQLRGISPAAAREVDERGK